MKELLLTLGHNSSAILIEDGKLQWGYETERISGTKSDSSFPHIVLSAKNATRPDIVYVSHWSPTGRLSNLSKKHWDPTVFDGIAVRTLTPSVSHHDTHIYSAMSYAGKEFTDREDRLYGLVIDGFGTLGEHLSIYEFQDGFPTLVKRVHGYETSLGLWYQYATAFMGMKMHEDEYKLLGYEVHCPAHCHQGIDRMTTVFANEWLDKMDKSVYGSKYDPMYDVAALENIKQKHFQHLASACREFDIDDPASFVGRSILAKYVQSLLEKVVMRVVRGLDAKHLLCSGGVFLNVKLNKRLLDYVEGQLCVHPLSGDQGNALGLYHYDYPGFMMPDNLTWGARKLHNPGKVDGMFFTDSEDDAKAYVLKMLKTRGYVNVVRGNMEYGPRALCNTSTLAIPITSCVDKINAANNRNTVMPMAPVMMQQTYDDLFVNTKKVWKSHRHMIVAMEYREDTPWKGVAHKYSENDLIYYTGRPQVIDPSDTFMADILRQFPCPLINTSFNYHGKPIAYDTASVIDNHILQYGRDNSFNTVVITNS